MSGHCLQLFEIGKVSMKIHVAKTVPSFHTLPLQTVPDLYFSLQYSVHVFPASIEFLFMQIKKGCPFYLLSSRGSFYRIEQTEHITLLLPI